MILFVSETPVHRKIRNSCHTWTSTKRLKILPSPWPQDWEVLFHRHRNISKYFVVGAYSDFSNDNDQLSST
jgi:hypothetical protein